MKEGPLGPQARALRAGWGGGVRRYLQGFVQVPAGLMQGLLGRVSRVAHSFQRVDVLQPASFLLFFLFPYLGQFL